MATEALVLNTQSAIEQMQDVLDQNYLRAWKIMSLSDPKPDKLQAVLPKINRMYQNVKAMITATDCNNLKVDVLTCDAYHFEFETSVNEWFCIISKLGYSSFEDSISDHNVSLATAFFCKSFSSRSSLKLSLKHLRADAELKIVQLEKIKRRGELMKLESLSHKACLPKCNANHVLGDCNDKIVQLEVNTKRAELKRLEYLERKACDVVRKAALASIEFHNDFSSLSCVDTSENLISEYLTVADQPSDLSCAVAGAFQCSLSVSDSTSVTLSSEVSCSFTESVLFVQPLNSLANKLAPCRPPPGFTEFRAGDQSFSAVGGDEQLYSAGSLSRAVPVSEYPANQFMISPSPVAECCDADCVVPTASVEIIVGFSSSHETLIYPSLTNVLTCAGLPAHDDRVLDFSEDESSFLGLVDADVHAGTTTNVVKDAGSLVDESLSLGLVTAEMHTEATAHEDGRVAGSPASGFSTDLADVNADVHIWTTVETDAIAASSIDDSSSSGSPVHDVELTGLPVSDVLNPCYFVSRSLDSDIPFFYPGHTKSAVVAGWGPGPPVCGYLLGLCNPVYALKSAVVAGLGPGPPVCGSLLGLCNPVYAFGSAVVVGLGPGPPVCGYLLGLCNPVYALKSAVVAGLGPGPPVCGSLLGLCNPVYALKSAVVAGLGPGPPGCGSLLGLCNPVYAFGSAVVAGLGPGPPVGGSLLGLCNPVYALKSAVVVGLGPGPLVCGSLLGLCNPVYALKSAVVAGLGPGPPVCGSLLGLCNPVYALKSAVVAGLGPGPLVCGSLLGLCNPVYALKSAVVAGLGPWPGPPVCGSLLGLCNPVYAGKLAVVAGLGPGPPVLGSLDWWNSVYALGLAVVAGLGPGPPAHEFLPFLDPILSSNYAWSTTGLANFESSSLPLCRKRLVLDASVILYSSIFLISLCDNLCVLLLNESYCCTQEFLFMNCATLNNNTLQRVVNICHYCC